MILVAVPSPEKRSCSEEETSTWTSMDPKGVEDMIQVVGLTDMRLFISR